MKKFPIYLLVSLIGVFLFANNFNNEDIPYYWEGEKKHYYEINTEILLIEFTIDRIDEQNINVAFPEAETYRIKNDTTLQLITRSKLSLLDKLSDKKDIIQHPAIKVKGTNSTSFITDEISVLFKSKKSESEVIEFADKLNLEYLTETSYGTHLFRVLEGGRTVAVANSIQENNEEVVWSNPNFVHLISLFNDPLYPDQYYLNNSGQGGGTANIDINAPEAWGISFGCDEIRIAVIDDGVENHEDFDGRVLAGFTAGVINTGGLPLNHCSKGHGVNCAGIIAASHNDIGLKGVAPNSQIVPINIFPNIPGPLNPAGAATNAEIATAINWAWRPDRGDAHILSNSWGGGNPNIDVTTQITNARTIGRNNLGAIVIFSSGNSHQTFSGVNYPATINGVITVGAINRNGNIWNYSRRGPEMDLVAPSGGLGNMDPFTFCINPNGDVVTTDREGALGYDPGNYTDGFGGTSAAAPQVAGVVALMLSVNPNLTEPQVRTILQQTATDMGATGFDNTYGFGRVNAHAAVQAALPNITGSDYLCSTTPITLENPPPGATVTWTTNPRPICSLQAPVRALQQT